MGHAVAEAARVAGCDVVLVSGPVSLSPPDGVCLVSVESSAEMSREIRARSDSSDVVVMAAAVSDFRPGKPVSGKIKKGGLCSLVLELERTEDILAALGKEKGGSARPFLVGFAAETSDLEANALEKLRRKNLDMIVANDVSLFDRGFGSDSNAAIVLHSSGEKTEIPLVSKSEFAERLVGMILERLERTATGVESMG
jgi:phosphopantothenoylcysteine decarboxylase/phosphopantothenate--cysteine ligase